MTFEHFFTTYIVSFIDPASYIIIALIGKSTINDYLGKRKADKLLEFCEQFEKILMPLRALILEHEIQGGRSATINHPRKDFLNFLGDEYNKLCRIKSEGLLLLTDEELSKIGSAVSGLFSITCLYEHLMFDSELRMQASKQYMDDPANNGKSLKEYQHHLSKYNRRLDEGLLILVSEISSVDVKFKKLRSSLHKRLSKD